MGAELEIKGLGDGMEVVPLTAIPAVSLRLPTGWSPKRRRAAFRVASRGPGGSRGGSDMVELVESESVREPELVSEVGEVESEAGVVADCGIGADVSRSAGRGTGWTKGCCSGNCIPHGYQTPSGP